MRFPDSGSNPRVILVDEQDNALGVQEKLRAHQHGGQLHRAFYIFIVDGAEQVLLQRRARSKYHCPGLFANSCCSHPQPAIPILRCARERLQVELGFSVPLQEIGAVQYRLPLRDGLTEWEHDHIFLGNYSGLVAPNPWEVEECRWVPFSQLEQDIRNQADHYVPWLPHIYPVLLEYLRGRKTAIPGGRVVNG
jgi:isopentenyl-diphosphate delta-isomerase